MTVMYLDYWENVDVNSYITNQIWMDMNVALSLASLTGNATGIFTILTAKVACYFPVHGLSKNYHICMFGAVDHQRACWSEGPHV